MSNLAQRRGAKAARRNKIVKAKRFEALAEKLEMKRSADILRLPDDSPFKASAALLDVAAILMNEDDDKAWTITKLKIAEAAWNVSLLPPDQHKAMAGGFVGLLLKNLRAGVDETAVREGFEEMFAALIARKLELYPHDNRRLVNVEIVEDERGRRVNVESELPL